MVTGAGGSIGSELCRQILRQQPVRLVLFELTEFALYQIDQELRLEASRLNLTVEIVPLLGSVVHQRRVEQAMRSFQIETVYHAAAYKHVPLVEFNPVEGVQNNVFGTWRTAQAAVAAGVRNFVLVSTDKAVRPTNVMGASKRYAELVLQAMAVEYPATCFAMVRFGNVLGSSGSVVPLFRSQLKAGGPITLTHPEITRYFMTIPEASQLVIQAGAMAKGGDVFVLDMGQPVKIIDMARRMIHLSGLEVLDEKNPEGDIEIRITGLRPGEKLYEELLIGDNVTGTTHPLIMRAEEEMIPWATLNHLLAEIDQACHTSNLPAMRQLLLKAVRGYQPTGEIEDLVWVKSEALAAAAVTS
jgi:FlaA1/EpsC-like NDP-sugar epimerase